MASFSLQGVSSNTVTIQSGNVDGIAISITATAIADVTDAMLQGINVSVTLIRGGRSFIILSGNAFALALSNKIGNLELRTVANTKAAILNFGEVVNLKPGDQMSIFVSTTTAASGMVTTVTTTESTEISEGRIPVVRVSTVNTVMGTQTHFGGDNVQMVSVVSDSATLFDISNLIISGDGYQLNLQTTDFIAYVSSQNDVVPEWLCFAAYQGKDLDNCQVSTNNVANAGNTYIVTYSYEYEEATIKAAANALQASQQASAAKISNALGS